MYHMIRNEPMEAGDQCFELFIAIAIEPTIFRHGERAYEAGYNSNRRLYGNQLKYFSYIDYLVILCAVFYPLSCVSSTIGFWKRDNAR